MYTHWTYYILTLQEVIKMDVDHIENLEKNLVVLYSYLCIEYIYALVLKGVFSKPSGNCIVVPNFCFLS